MGETLDRLITASKTSLRHLTSLIMEDQDKSDNAYLRVFKPSKDEFDFVINLKPEAVTNYSKYTWKTKKGSNDWKEQQLLKRMNRLKLEKQTKKEKNNRQKKKMDADERIEDIIGGDILPFIPNK